MSNDDERDARRLAVVLRDSSNAITVQDLHGRILAWNRGASLTYGYSEAEAIDMCIMKIVPKDLQEELVRKLEEVSQGFIVQGFQTKRVRKDDVVIDIWLIITCLRDSAGQINAIATTEMDLSSPLSELSRILPICSSCKKIRDEAGLWHEVECYIQDHSNAQFSHSLCQKCAEKLYPKFRKSHNQ
jgi:PAS domain S-box-containing protein